MISESGPCGDRGDTAIRELVVVVSFVERPIDD
jgi:hypothetical protein